MKLKKLSYLTIERIIIVILCSRTQSTSNKIPKVYAITYFSIRYLSSFRVKHCPLTSHDFSVAKNPWPAVILKNCFFITLI